MYFSWNHEKNEQLVRERGISFEEVVFHIERGDVLDVLEHPNDERYPEQRLFVVAVDDYAYLVPFVESEEELFLKTIIPSRKATKRYLGGRWMPKLDKEEKELVESFDAGEWESVRDKEGALKRYQDYARATFRKDRRVNIRITSKDLEALQKRALTEGIPYQTLITSILHKYIQGRLKEQNL